MGEILANGEHQKLQINFSKVHGAQNDFVAIDNRENKVQLTAEDRQKICHRHGGIGADGMFEIHQSHVADFKLMHFSSKGNITELCGNGTRCAVAFCKRLGLPYRTISESGKPDDSTAEHKRTTDEHEEAEREILEFGFPKSYYIFEAFDGVHYGTIPDSDGDCCVRMCGMDLADIKINQNGDYNIDSGSPHHVRFLPCVEDLDAEALGREINRELYKEAGCHVNFVSGQLLEDESESILRGRTYEYTVDYETRACGTGSIAMAIADVIRTLLQESATTTTTNEDEANDDRVSSAVEEAGKAGEGKRFSRKIKMHGGILQVHFRIENKRVTSIWLQGPATHVMDGRYWL